MDYRETRNEWEKIDMSDKKGFGILGGHFFGARGNPYGD